MHMVSLKHLSRDDHHELARLLNQAQESLDAATMVINRAAFTDRVTRANKQIQEHLIDPLSLAWHADHDDSQTNPYPNCHYVV
jgi:hypothetical protein